jgi:hypothetical protein
MIKIYLESLSIVASELMGLKFEPSDRCARVIIEAFVDSFETASSDLENIIIISKISISLESKSIK